MLTILIRGYRVSDSGVQIVIELAEKKNFRTKRPSRFYIKGLQLYFLAIILSLGNLNSWFRLSNPTFRNFLFEESYL